MLRRDESILGRIAKGRDWMPRSDSPDIALAEPREGCGGELGLNGTATQLELRRTDGNEGQGTPWYLFTGWQWKRGGEWEDLTLLFSNRVVRIEGRNLAAAVMLLRAGRLEYFQQHNSVEQSLLLKADETADTAHKKAIIKSITVEPDFGALVEAVKG